VTLDIVVNGLLLGSGIGLGAIGLTLTFAILGFSNFAHGELVTAGAYLALVQVGLINSVVVAGPLAGLSFGWPLIAAAIGAMALTGLLAFGLDRVLFSRLRRKGTEVTLVIASFAASLAMRSAIEVLFGPQATYYSRELQIVENFGPFRMTRDQGFVLVVTLLLVLAIHVVLTHTHLGRAMRATSENRALAETAGINTAAIVRDTWFIGGALAAAAGVLIGVTVQIRPYMGYDLLLPLFSAAVLGGLGSIPGAIVGGFAIGIAESVAVPFVGGEYRSAVSFGILITVLMVRPAGLFGVRA
jgi:branched-chain amino acid transport system permease protein